MGEELNIRNDAMYIGERFLTADEAAVAALKTLINRIEFYEASKESEETNGTITCYKCDRPVTCGTPTDIGYVRSCGEHKPKQRHK